MTDKKTEATDGYSAETQWVHLFRELVFSGDIAKIGGQALAVYITIKAHVEFTTGHSFPSVKEIGKHSGLSERQVRREMKTLEENGYLRRNKVGRNNTYTLREKITVRDGDQPTAIASWDYIPAVTKQAVEELKNFVVTGDDRTTQIHIEHLTIENVNVVQGDQWNGGSQIIGNDAIDRLDPAMRAKLQSIQAKAKRRK